MVTHLDKSKHELRRYLKHTDTLCESDSIFGKSSQKRRLEINWRCPFSQLTVNIPDFSQLWQAQLCIHNHWCYTTKWVTGTWIICIWYSAITLWVFIFAIVSVSFCKFSADCCFSHCHCDIWQATVLLYSVLTIASKKYTHGHAVSILGHTLSAPYDNMLNHMWMCVGVCLSRSRCVCVCACV